jgi:hypothetical protein
MTDLDRKLAEFQAEQKQLELEIRQRRSRLSELRLIITGDKDVMGLAPQVEAERRKREWIDGEPTRAAVRATPEYQAWRTQFMADEAERVIRLMEWWEEEKLRRALL